MKTVVLFLLRLSVAVAAIFSVSVSFALSIGNSTSPSSCTYDDTDGVSIGGMLDNCKPASAVDIPGSDYTIEGGFRDKILLWANYAILLGSLLAIGSCVYSGYLFVASMGDDAKHKTARNAVLYSLLGFALMLLATPIINMVVNLIFQISG